jgi:hypothetical protein
MSVPPTDNEGALIDLVTTLMESRRVTHRASRFVAKTAADRAAARIPAAAAFLRGQPNRAYAFVIGSPLGTISVTVRLDQDAPDMRTSKKEEPR